MPGVHLPELSVEDNAEGWGPLSEPPQFKDVPFMPYSKGDRLGRIADFGQMASQRQYQGGWRWCMWSCAAGCPCAALPLPRPPGELLGLCWCAAPSPRSICRCCRLAGRYRDQQSGPAVFNFEKAEEVRWRRAAGSGRSAHLGMGDLRRPVHAHRRALKGSAAHPPA